MMFRPLRMTLRRLVLGAAKRSFVFIVRNTPRCLPCLRPPAAFVSQSRADVVGQGKNGDENGYVRSVVGEHENVLAIGAGIAVGIVPRQVAEEIAQLLVRRVGADAEIEDPIQHAHEGVAVPSRTLSGALVGMGRGGKLDHGGKGFRGEC